MMSRGFFSNVLKPKLWLSLGLLALLIFLATRLTGVWRQQSAVDKEIASLKQEAAKAQSQNSQFKKMIDYLESDQFAEEQAKLKLGLKKEGERVAVVTGLDVATTAATTSDAGAASGSLRDNWHHWLEYFWGQ